MINRFFLAIVMLGLSSVSPLGAQGWDAPRQASGWAYQEVDGSLVFYDPAGRSLRTWMKGSGLLGSLPVTLPGGRKAPAAAKPTPSAPKPTSDYDAAGALLYGTPRHLGSRAAIAEAPPQELREVPGASGATPERWVIDPYNRIWMTCEGQLAVIAKDGKTEQLLPLAAAVEDMAVLRDGVLLLYRTMKPFLEKRDLKTGAVLWTFGDKAQAKEAAAQPLRVPLNRMALGVDGTIYLAEGASLAFTVLDPARGPLEPGQSFFTCQGVMPARPVLGRVGRGPLLSWSGRDVLFGAFAPSQVRSCGAPESKGLLLARFNLGNGTLDWLPTSITEGHRLVGLLETEAVFLAPEGGLAFAPIH